MADSNGHTTELEGGVLRRMSALFSRLGLTQRLGSMQGGKREVHALLGYKDALRYEDYLARYLRQDLASVIVKAYPEKTWGIPPRVAEEGEHATPTPFEAAWDALALRLNLFGLFERADILAQLGHYSVLLLGLRNQTDLGLRARPVTRPEDLMYVQLYSEEHATIERFYENPDEPTYGKPQFYRLNPGVNEISNTKRPRPKSLTVHASRILHIPGQDLLDDELYANPCLEKVYDNLDDLLMIRGGAAYGWWQDAKRRFIAAVQKDRMMTAEDAENFAREAEEFDLLKNFMRVDGIDITPVRGEAANPAAHFAMQVDLIAAATRHPKRILMGSERGEQASDQDEREFLGNVARRQEKYAGPRIVRGMVDLCIDLHIVPRPARPYVLHWENLLTLTEAQQATIAKDVATAVRTAVGTAGDFREGMSMEQFVDEYLGIEFTGLPVEKLLMLMPTDEGASDVDETEETADAETREDGTAADADRDTEDAA